MFRLVVLSTVLAVAAASHGATLVASSPLAYSHVAAVPAVVAQKEISYQKSIIEEPTITHVGNIEKKIPTGHSYQSFTQYHNKQVAEHVYAPAVKKTIVETPVEKTVYKTAAVATPAISYAAPAHVQTAYIESAPALTYAAAPIAKAAYVEAAPALAYAAAPIAKAAYVEAAPALTYAKTSYVEAAPALSYATAYGTPLAHHEYVHSYPTAYESVPAVYAKH
ncbi:cuticle protein 16.5-like [Toxorhynchites rutilus septentrionalis]|uniref:cuticle protein 16.5-like n=1 Tax=Toxorhynchites rutilus septentrionalis TaxID=329112 RepID=UPI0024798D67|nr:cuticle protein 16.5-like [Toxorhynchites rutilus septentrionalis]